MNKTQFREASQGFVQWAGTFSCDRDGHLVPASYGALTRLIISLNIPRSSRVPVAIQEQVPFHKLTQAYIWRAMDMASGSYAETRDKIFFLSTAVSMANDDASTLKACEAIAIWGGDRRSDVGALPFLKDLSSIRTYLGDVKAELTLETATIPSEGHLLTVKRMNSMLTKIHAFNSDDGLPIYDSRVAAAIATLVESWRRECEIPSSQFPMALSFPEVGGGGRRRSVLARYPDAVRPPILRYPTSKQNEDQLRHASAWAAAKVRLGWLLYDLLEEPSVAGMRAMEACLFMAGYDSSGIGLKLQSYNQQ